MSSHMVVPRIFLAASHPKFLHMNSYQIMSSTVGKHSGYFHQNINEFAIIMRIIVLWYMCEWAKSLPDPHKWRIQHGLGFNSACPRALDLLNGKFWRCNLANYALKTPPGHKEAVQCENTSVINHLLRMPAVCLSVISNAGYKNPLSMCTSM